MSHITTLEASIKKTDIKFVSAACKALGLSFVQGASTFKWYHAVGECDHKIVVPGASYEIGLKANNNEYSLLFDEYSEGGLAKKVGRGAGLLLQRIAAEKAIHLARAEGYSVTETTDKDKNVVLHLRNV